MQLGAFDDLHRAVPELARPSDQGASVATIGPEVFELPPRVLAKEPPQQMPRTVPVLKVGRQHPHEQDQSEGID